MGDIKRVLDSLETITHTELDSLADNQIWAAAGINVGTETLIDIAIQGAFTTLSSPTGTIQVKVAGSIDNGTTYSGNVSGTEGEDTSGIIIGNVLGFPPIQCNSGKTFYEWGPFYVRTVFPEIPQYFAPVVLNASGVDLAASGNSIKYRLVRYNAA